MKKKLVVIISTIIMILSIMSLFSVNAFSTEKKLIKGFPELTNPGFSVISGRVVKRLGNGEPAANVFVYIGKDPEHSTFYKNIFNDREGYYKESILTGGNGITLQIRAVIITFDWNGDVSQWEELRVLPHNHYVVPDLVLPEWPIKKQQSFNPFQFGFLQKSTVIYNIFII